MIKKLQHKFIRIAIGSMAGILLTVVLGINILNIVQTNQGIHTKLQILSDNNGAFSDNHAALPSMPAQPDTQEQKPQLDGSIFDSPGWNAETKYRMRYFSVLLSSSGEVLSSNIDHIAAVDLTQAVDYANAALRSGKTTGLSDAYRFLAVEKTTGTLFIFLDCQDELHQCATLAVISGGIFLVSMVILFVLVTVLSGRAIRPVAESLEKQKQFITDASHEIKTPLSIISANADVLELCGQDNEWVQSIKHQTSRLNKLVKSLTALARMDEERLPLVCCDFSVSDAVFDAASPFVTLAQSQKKSFTLQIQPNLTLRGDEGAIRQLVSLLSDNAVKYADIGSEITLCLYRKGKSTVLETQNCCAGMDCTHLDRLFDRFYRADSSRARETGGSGIGLSIAKAIVDAHQGKISARCDDGKTVVFTAVF